MTSDGNFGKFHAVDELGKRRVFILNNQDEQNDLDEMLVGNRVKPRCTDMCGEADGDFRQRSSLNHKVNTI